MVGSCERKETRKGGVRMRTIAIEEHFLADGVREAMKRDTPGQGGGSNAVFVAEQQAKLADLGSTRLKDMDAVGFNLQVISHTASSIVPLSGCLCVAVVRDANHQFTPPVAPHPP